MGLCAACKWRWLCLIACREVNDALDRIDEELVAMRWLPKCGPL